MIFFQYGSYSCLWIFPISLTVFFRNTNYLCIYSLVFNIHIFCIYVRSQTAPWNLPVSGLCSKTISEMGSSSGSSRYSFFLCSKAFFTHFIWFFSPLLFLSLNKWKFIHIWYLSKNRRVEVPLAPFYLLDSWGVHSICSSPGSQHDFP